MRVLVACEFSGVVREAFRKRGHEAYSCDLIESSDGSPHHVVGNVLDYLHNIPAWDMVIAHPPCTYISNMSNCRINEPGRRELRKAGLEFFLAFTRLSHVSRVAIENPRGLPERAYRKPSQIIQPWQFGHPQSKATCLWLKNLPPLRPTNVVEPRRVWDGKRYRTFVDNVSNWRGDAHQKRSITFQGIADAMAAQWGDGITEKQVAGEPVLFSPGVVMGMEFLEHRT